MADVALQREARRRKITQNAEARMNRLLGLTRKHDHNNDSTSQSELNESSSQNSPPHSQQNEAQPSSLHLRSRNSTASTSLPSRNISSFSSPECSDRNSKRSSEIISSHHSTPVSCIRGDLENIDRAHLTPSGRSELEVKRTDKLTNDTQRLSAQTFEICKIIAFVVLAFLQCCALKFGLGLCIVPSIFVPYIVLEVTFEYVVYNYLQHILLSQPKGNLMSAALMLCGMKQDFTDTYNSIMARVAVWLSDFCLYLFAFIVWDLFIV
ncbi:hypothetical protein BsWGS_06148 [Bradybaena similaris]